MNEDDDINGRLYSNTYSTISKEDHILTKSDDGAESMGVLGVDVFVSNSFASSCILCFIFKISADSFGY